GMYVPPRVVTNFDLEKLMDTTDEWIQKRSGIKERRWASPGETTLEMAALASQQALDRANLKADDIDMIIFGCLVSDFIFPGTGVLLQERLGFQRTVPALDIRNQCSGFVYGIQLADSLIRTHSYKRVRVVGSEIHSGSLDVSDEGRDIAVLFGDGAGAMIFEACDEATPHIIDSELHSEGKFAPSLTIQKPSSNDLPRIKKNYSETREHFPVMDGKLVFKNAVTRMTEVVQSLLAKNDVATEQVDFVIAHQANMRINNMVMEQLKIPHTKTHHTLDRYGNTTMATIPITFDEAVQLGKIKRGDLVVFVAFGAGFTWGANLLRY
ncbi:MAG: ketoacyl-ACP synthase III, partial [Bdellovibrionales bacterium]